MNWVFVGITVVGLVGCQPASETSEQSGSGSESESAELFPSVPAYPASRLLCTQHVNAGPTHITWRGYVSRDPVDQVRAFYEQRLASQTGSAAPALERSPASLRIRLAQERVVSIQAVGAGHPTCDVAPASTDRTFIVVSQPSD